MLLIAFIILLFSTICFPKKVTIEDFKVLEGKNKWIALKNYFISKKQFFIPPNSEIQFKDGNVLLSVGYRLKEKIYKQGIWFIDSDKGFIYLKIPHTEIRGHAENKFYSFDLVCNTEGKKEYCHFMFYTGRLFKKPKNIEEEFASGDYLQISP